MHNSGPKCQVGGRRNNIVVCQNEHRLQFLCCRGVILPRGRSKGWLDLSPGMITISLLLQAPELSSTLWRPPALPAFLSAREDSIIRHASLRLILHTASLLYGCRGLSFHQQPDELSRDEMSMPGTYPASQHISRYIAQGYAIHRSQPEIPQCIWTDFHRRRTKS